MTQAAPRSGVGSGDTFDSLDPSSGAVVASFPAMGPADVAAVVRRADTAGRWWAARSVAARRAALLAWAAHLVRHADELVGLVHREQGKRRDDAYLELVPALEQIRWAARNAGRVLRTRRVMPNLPMANHLAEVEYVPYGVVGVIGPWNYPVFTPTGSIAYALAAGNSVVFKPSEHTTAVGEYLVRAFAAANPDAPDGVLGLVTGMGPTGAALLEQPLGKVAFTGSPATGRLVMAACARRLVPLVLECGGKDAMIVAGDADVAAAAEAAVWGGMSNSGQTCVGIERVYVVASVRDRFLEELRRQLAGVHVGPGQDSAYGPMSTPQQLEIVRRQLDEALQAGALPLVGGYASVDHPFIGPVVLVDPPEDCAVCREETFGPILAVQTVADVDDAIRLTNDSPYGLGASVFSRRHGKAIARRITSGMIAVNCGLAFVGIPGLPFGGQRESGFGRVHGADGLREFAQPRSVAERAFNVPGMNVATLRPRPATLRAVRILMNVRHGRLGRGQGK